MKKMLRTLISGVLLLLLVAGLALPGFAAGEISKEGLTAAVTAASGEAELDSADAYAGEEVTIEIDASSYVERKKKNNTKSKTVQAESKAADAELTVEEDGSYSTKEEVALYIHTYDRLPSNYIRKKEAEKLGWVSSKGNLWDVAPGKSIGGDRFGNYEGLLPEAKGRSYTECDIDFDGGWRNAKRIIFSNDGLIYYTEDHYKTFEQLYDAEKEIK